MALTDAQEHAESMASLIAGIAVGVALERRGQRPSDPMDMAAVQQAIAPYREQAVALARQLIEDVDRVVAAQYGQWNPPATYFT